MLEVTIFDKAKRYRAIVGSAKVGTRILGNMGIQDVMLAPLNIEHGAT